MLDVVSISGQVRGTDGRPAWNATVVVSPVGGSGKVRFGLADEDGQFQVDGIVPGVYQVRVNQRQYRIYSFAMEIMQDETGLLIELEPDPYAR